MRAHFRTTVFLCQLLSAPLAFAYEGETALSTRDWLQGPGRSIEKIAQWMLIVEQDPMTDIYSRALSTNTPIQSDASGVDPFLHLDCRDKAVAFSVNANIRTEKKALELEARFDQNKPFKIAARFEKNQFTLIEGQTTSDLMNGLVSHKRLVLRYVFQSETPVATMVFDISDTDKIVAKLAPICQKIP